MKQIYLTMVILSITLFLGIAHSEEISPELRGLIKESTEQYRTEHYSKHLHDVYKSDQDESEALVQDGDLLINQMLGADFPKEKQQALNIIQRKMFLKRKALEELFDSKDLTLDSFQYQLEKVSTDSFVSASKILSDDEFEALFGFSKKEIPVAFDRIVEKQPNKK